MLIPKGAMAQVKHLANTRLLPDTCTVVRYQVTDDDTRTELGRAVDVPCRLALRALTLDLGQGVIYHAEGAVTFSHTPVAFTNGAGETVALDAPDINDDVLAAGLCYRIDQRPCSRVDGETLTYTAYLQTGYPVEE